MKPGLRIPAGQAGRRLTLAAVAGAVATAFLFGSCSRGDQGATQGRPGGRPAVPVLVAPAVTRDMPVEIRAIGTVQAYSMVSIRSQITAPITDVHFQEGQEVRAGDLLFTLDARPWAAALNQAQANLKREEAQLFSARLQFLRTSNLFESKIASRADYDAAEAVYRALEAALVADGAAVSNAQVFLSYTTIRSPVDGRTGDLSVKAGNVVKATDDVLLTLTQIHPIYVAFSVPEQELSAIRREWRGAALPMEAVVPGETNRPAAGTLTFINNTVDANTGTILLKGTFPNTNDVLWPGQFVQVSLTLSNLAQATVLPSQTVQTGQTGDYVFVVKPDQTVDAVPVTTSVSRDGLTVVTSGVKPGDLVVTDGQMNLIAGTAVSIKSPAPLGGAGTGAVSAASSQP